MLRLCLLGALAIIVAGDCTNYPGTFPTGMNLNGCMSTWFNLYDNFFTCAESIEYLKVALSPVGDVGTTVTFSLWRQEGNQRRILNVHTLEVPRRSAGLIDVYDLPLFPRWEVLPGDGLGIGYSSSEQEGSRFVGCTEFYDPSSNLLSANLDAETWDTVRANLEGGLYTPKSGMLRLRRPAVIAVPYNVPVVDPGVPFVHTGTTACTVPAYDLLSTRSAVRTPGTTTSIDVVCNPGYAIASAAPGGTPSPTGTLLCNGPNTVSGHYFGNDSTSPCVLQVPCPPIKSASASVTYTTSVIGYLTLVRVQCGNEMAEVSQCTINGWEPHIEPQFQCAQTTADRCDRITIGQTATGAPTGDVTYLHLFNGNIQPQTVAVINCHENFKGSTSISCTAAGQWSRPLNTTAAGPTYTCDSIQPAVDSCPRIVVENGAITYISSQPTRNVEFGTIGVITCNNGFVNSRNVQCARQSTNPALSVWLNVPFAAQPRFTGSTPIFQCTARQIPEQPLGVGYHQHGRK